MNRIGRRTVICMAVISHRAGRHRRRNGRRRLTAGSSRRAARARRDVQGLERGCIGRWPVANCSLPAVTTSMILLATPVAGVVGSAVVFGEVATPSLMIAMAMILGGISTGVLSGSNSAQT
jgi:hypothetical protein